MARNLTTRFTERFNLEHPIALAPMDTVAGGALAAAVANAGGLGLIGGGYGDEATLTAAIADAGNTSVGVGFITWSALRTPDVVDIALARSPKALMVSFGDAEPFIEKAKAADVPTLWQVQTLAQARQAIEAEVDVIVVQGQEAGGHGMTRGLMALLPAVRDSAPRDQIILGAGGIADGRGLAGVLALGGDGVLMGTRFWASIEAVGAEGAKQLMTKTTGDETLRTKVFDVARDVDWPWHFTGRVRRNDFVEQSHADIEAIRNNPDVHQKSYAASADDDFDTRVLIAGEALDLIHDIPSAADIVTQTAEQAAKVIAAQQKHLTG